jgi:phage tail-like protein
MANTGLPKATYRCDPYRNYKFRVKWDGKYVAGVSKVSALSRSTQVISHRADGRSDNAAPYAGQSKYQPIILERGVTHDAAFEQWGNKVWGYHSFTFDDQQGGTGNQDVSQKNFRKDIILEVYNEAGQKVIAYNIYRCWPSEFTALPKMDVNGNGVAIQVLKLENEGWERDTTVEEPDEPSFTLPAR